MPRRRDCATLSGKLNAARQEVPMTGTLLNQQPGHADARGKTPSILIIWKANGMSAYRSRRPCSSFGVLTIPVRLLHKCGPILARNLTPLRFRTRHSPSQ
jgi:hypothetical protein